MDEKPLSKVAEGDSEGDADQDIISDEDDEGVDPTAYGDEEGSETEAEVEAPPKKKEYFKRKPTVYVEPEVTKEKKPGVPRAPHRMKKEEREK